MLKNTLINIDYHAKQDNRFILKLGIGTKSQLEKALITKLC